MPNIATSRLSKLLFRIAGFNAAAPDTTPTRWLPLYPPSAVGPCSFSTTSHAEPKWAKPWTKHGTFSFPALLRPCKCLCCLGLRKSTSDAGKSY